MYHDGDGQGLGVLHWTAERNGRVVDDAGAADIIEARRIASRRMTVVPPLTLRTPTPFKKLDALSPQIVRVAPAINIAPTGGTKFAPLPIQTFERMGPMRIPTPTIQPIPKPTVTLRDPVHGPIPVEEGFKFQPWMIAVAGGLLFLMMRK